MTKNVRVVSLCLLGIGFMPLAGYGWQSDMRSCPYLDGKAQPFYHVELGFVPDARIENRGPNYSHMELRTGGALVYFHDIAYGDIDLNVRFDSLVPLRKSAVDIPSHLMALVLETRWFWRYINDTALELTFAPGFYASTEDVLDMPLAIPVTAAGIYAPSPALALVAGLQVRPGFSHILVPYGGVVWAPHAQFRVEATVPEARMTVHLDREWSGYAGWKWDSTTYSIQPDDAGRNRLTIVAQEWYLGVSRGLFDELRIHGSLGLLTDREIRVTRSRSKLRERASIDDGMVLRVGVAGAF
ncbi:MAG: hypothetical protein ACNA71_02250 [Kiritimatiellia bacterium]